MRSLRCCSGGLRSHCSPWRTSATALPPISPMGPHHKTAGRYIWARGRSCPWFAMQASAPTAQECHMTVRGQAANGFGMDRVAHLLRFLWLAAVVAASAIPSLAVASSMKQSDMTHASMMARAGHFEAMRTTSSEDTEAPIIDLCKQHCLTVSTILPADMRPSGLREGHAAPPVAPDATNRSLPVLLRGKPPKPLMI